MIATLHPRRRHGDRAEGNRHECLSSSRRKCGRGPPGWPAVRDTRHRVVSPTLSSAAPARASASSSAGSPGSTTPFRDGLFGSEDLGGGLRIPEGARAPNRPRRRGALARLPTARTPTARYPGTTSRSTRPARTCSSSAAARSRWSSTTSTGATGNTPLGTWHVYRKVGGFDWVLLLPDLLPARLRSPRVPRRARRIPPRMAASAIPMWIATTRLRQIRLGSSIYIYVMASRRPVAELANGSASSTAASSTPSTGGSSSWRELRRYKAPRARLRRPERRRRWSRRSSPRTGAALRARALRELSSAVLALTKRELEPSEDSRFALER